jgi:HEAT repeat protein
MMAQVATWSNDPLPWRDRARQGLERYATSSKRALCEERTVLPHGQPLEPTDSPSTTRAGAAVSPVARAAGAVLKLCDDPDSQVRWLAAEAAGRIGDGDGVDGRVAIASHEKLTKSPDARLRERGLDSLGCLHATAAPAVPRVLDCRKDPCWRVRWRFAWMCAEIGNGCAEAAVPALVDLLDDPMGDVRERAAESLELLGRGSPSALRGLVRALEHPDADTRRRAALSLGAFGDDAKSAREALLELLKKDPDEGVRAAAGVAIAIH